MTQQTNKNVQDGIMPLEFACFHLYRGRAYIYIYIYLYILLDKTPIKVVTEAKFLGVIFDRTISYSSHVKYLKTNCLKALDILKVVGHTDWGAEQKTLCLCRALVRSKSDYGCIIYGAASNNILKKLDPIYHQGL